MSESNDKRKGATSDAGGHEEGPSASAKGQAMHVPRTCMIPGSSSSNQKPWRGKFALISRTAPVILPSASCGVSVALNCPCGSGSSQNPIALVWCLFKSSRNCTGGCRNLRRGSSVVRLWFVCGSSKVRR